MCCLNRIAFKVGFGLVFFYFLLSFLIFFCFGITVLFVGVGRRGFFLFRDILFFFL